MVSLRYSSSRISLMAAMMLAGVAAAHAQTGSPLPGGGGYNLSGAGIAVQAKTSHGEFLGLRITDLLSSRSLELRQAFTITMKDGSVLNSSNLQMQRPLTFNDVPADPQARVAADRLPGKRICADFTDTHQAGTLHWCLLMRAHSGYFRQELTIHAGHRDMPIAEVRLLDFEDAGAHVSGTVKGSPVVDQGMFFGFEHPLSSSRVDNGHVTAALSRELPLRAYQSVTYSSVIGVAPAGQMRRSFLAYLEAERPRVYRPFLTYNSWYDLGYGNTYDEAGAVDRVRAFGSELEQKRHVPIDSFLFDDGWDNPTSLWGFNKGFPDGFTKVAASAAKYHAGIGVWLSPWGGYEEKQQRVAYGRQHGYEIIHNGFALSGPKYYRRFEQTCFEMIDRYGVNQFKFDGTGNADRVFPGSEFDSDFDAAIHLIGKIRQHKPGIFINLTTGTYPSPFWLFYADSIWRGGEDHAFAGVGSSRQRWITYRDQETYRNIVLSGPLFPLNSLMLHGIIYARLAEGLSSDPNGDFPSEVQSYVGSGTQLQEMYITPSLLNEANWSVLAHAALWARKRSSILEDTHWIGGDPGRLQVYGWAAWSPQGWIVTLRNPSDHVQTFSLGLQATLELPHGAPSSYVARDPFGKRGSFKLTTHQPLLIPLAPFEVLTFESIIGQ